MRQGFRVVDADTHVNPSTDVLLRYADGELKQHLGELQAYIQQIDTKPGRGDDESKKSYGSIVVKPVRLQRVAGRKPSATVDIKGPVGFLSTTTEMVTTRKVQSGVGEDNSRGRLEDMDIEGRDVDFVIPGPWAYAAPTLPAHLTRALFDAYHRYMADFCSADTTRLKSMIVVPANDPEHAAKVIRALANAPWVSAVWPSMPEGLPVDDPDLDPIWAAANEADLPIMYHAFTVEPPYFPGYRDLWDNAAVGRCAGQTWGGQRFLSYMLISGVMDRYPNLRVATLESGHGWLPHWLTRLTRQIAYVKGAVPPELKHTPLEFAQMGRVFCSIDVSEGVEMTKSVIDLLGDQVLMFASDYPHPETTFPKHVDSVVAWRERLGDEALRKMLWDNAARFFRL